MKTKKILTIIGGGLASAGFLPLVSVSCFDTNKSKDENTTTAEKSLSKIFNGTSSISISAKDEKSVLEALKSGNNSLKIDDLKVIFDENENKITVMPKDGTTTYSDKIVIPFVLKPQGEPQPANPGSDEETDEPENAYEVSEALKEAEMERRKNTPIEEANYKAWARQDAFKRERNKEFNEAKLSDEFLDFISFDWSGNEEHEKQWAEWERSVNTPSETASYNKWNLTEWYKRQIAKEFKDKSIGDEFSDFISPYNAADFRREIEEDFNDPEYEKLNGEAATEKITNTALEEEFYKAWQGAEEERAYWTNIEKEYFEEKEAEVAALKVAEDERIINTAEEEEFFAAELERLTNTPIELEDYEDWLAYPEEFEKANKEYEEFAKSDDNKKWEKAEKAAEFKKKYDVDLEKLEKNSDDILDNSAAANGISNWEKVTPESRKHITDISDSIISNSDAVRESEDTEE
ncbi:Hypothetical protein, predicted lipoprotein [Mycoplasmopsis agalactiae 14628]|uniref:Lipoprotein n=1 Tax=Mycoplasmopsis agalactiae 14628 TaxID=1110504 RepID=I5D515_MYCAA|nr:hypothetical protein [Mycoplasmopsis agalactiae]EIN14774.1 Hypothetical protein, predicted lipoprotein [Mycoplasmopsis agalactiae 14628]